MNEQLMEMLGASAMAQPSLEERRAEMEKLRSQLNHFTYGAAFPKEPRHEAYSMQTIAQLIDIGALRVRDGMHPTIELTALGRYEADRLAAVVKEIDVQLAAQQREEEELAAAVAAREAELNAPHPDFATHQVGQDETPPADTYDAGPVEYGDEDPSPAEHDAEERHAASQVRTVLPDSEHDPSL